MMTEHELALKLQEVSDRADRNEGRIKKLEGEYSTLQSLATSVAVMAEQLKNLNGNVLTLGAKVEHLEAKPGKRWDAVVEKALMTIVAAVVGFLVSQLGFR